MSTQALREITLNAHRNLRVDREAAIIRDVKVIGGTSANGRKYPQDVLEKARPMYEGCQVNKNHLPRDGNKDRLIEDRIGKLVNVRTHPTDGLVADFHYLKTDPFAEKMCEIAERMPEQFGLSHNAQGRATNKGGVVMVEEITSVGSVDLVSDPATTKSLFESIERDSAQHLTQYVEIVEKQNPGDLGAAFLREMMAQGFAHPQMPMPAAPQPPQAMAQQQPGGNMADAGIKQAIKQMIVAVLDDASMDGKAAMGRIMEILKSQERIMGKGTNNEDPNAKPGDNADPNAEGGAPSGDKTKEKKPVPESKEPTVAELQEQLRVMKAAGEARELLDTAGIPATAPLVEALAMLPDTDARKKLIEGLPKAGPQLQPRSTAPRGGQKFSESKVPDGSKPEDVAKFLTARG